MVVLIDPELGRLNIDGGPDRSGVRWVNIYIYIYIYISEIGGNNRRS